MKFIKKVRIMQKIIVFSIAFATTVIYNEINNSQRGVENEQSNKVH